MKNLKNKLVAVAVTLVVALGLGGLGYYVQNDKDVNVVKEHGYMVLDKYDTKDESTIVATIVDDSDKDKDGYIEAVNVFDKKDTVAIGKDFAKGEVVLITFTNDSVTKVELNKLNIADKVKGQKIIK